MENLKYTLEDVMNAHKNGYSSGITNVVLKGSGKSFMVAGIVTLVLSVAAVAALTAINVLSLGIALPVFLAGMPKIGAMFIAGGAMIIAGAAMIYSGKKTFEGDSQKQREDHLHTLKDELNTLKQRKVSTKIETI